MRVLVCEDETIIRLDLCQLLDGAGMTVVGEARDGAEAVRLATELEPDIILMDVRMPELDGIEAARRILADRQVPIVMVTAFAEREIVQQASEAGAFGYLLKPFRQDDVLAAITTAQARSAELAEARKEAKSLTEALETRRFVERAKGMLMQTESLSEADAYARMRSASQRTGSPCARSPRHCWQRSPATNDPPPRDPARRRRARPGLRASSTTPSATPPARSPRALRSFSSPRSSRRAPTPCAGGSRRASSASCSRPSATRQSWRSRCSRCAPISRRS